MPEDKLALKLELAGNLLREIANTGQFQPDYAHRDLYVSTSDLDSIGELLVEQSVKLKESIS
jgi:hypothetical protein